jgi:hypothetical protein
LLSAMDWLLASLRRRIGSGAEYRPIPHACLSSQASRLRLA